MNKNIGYIFLSLAISSSLWGQSAKDIAKHCLPSTISLVMEDNYKQPISIGSGFIIGDGKVVTNLHVIEGAKYGYVFVSGSTIKHKIQGYFSIDKQNDLAILSIPTITGKSLPLTPSIPEIGEKIYAISNPKGLSGTISEGIVSGIRTLENKKLIQITAPISPGSSGGPVINNSGQVIGVAVGTLASGQNLNFAIPSTLLQNLIAKNGNALTPLNIQIGAASPKTEKGEIDIKDGISIRNIKYKSGIWSSTGVEEHHKLLQSFSFKNNLPYKVSNILVLIIVYDKYGVPLDYKEETYLRSYRFLSSDTGIKPFLAKTISIRDNTSIRAFRLENNYEKIEIRILDFRILENE